jgi:5-methylcytosine-specific restriction endonuclease McrA
MTRRQACLCGRIDCQRHKPAWGWASKKNKAARDANYASPAYRHLRREILASKPMCSYPGCTKVADTLDHIIPISRDGSNARENVRPMCRKHNEALGRDLGNQMKRRRK